MYKLVENMITWPAVSLALIIAVFAADVSASDAVGGGFAERGVRGAWYANAEFKGEPAFRRRDVRIDFDWGVDRRPGGSIADGLQTIGVDHYSVVWTGVLIPRFTEEYTIHLTADDGAQMRVRPAGREWTSLINAMDKAGVHAAKLPMRRGERVEFELRYVERTGPAKAILEWSGPSFPREVIDPVFQMSSNNLYRETLFTDALRCGRANWEKVAIDKDGWPTGDGEFIFSEILAPCHAEPLETGRMELSFTGKADVTVMGNCEVVPNSATHDAATGVTTVLLNGVDKGWNVAAIQLKNAVRPDGKPGVTEVRLMRPLKPGALEFFPRNTLFHPVATEAYTRFTGVRHQRVNDQAREWSERTPADSPYQNQSRPFVYNDRYGGGVWNLMGLSQMSHETEIMFANTIGADYYVCLPHLASNEYVRKFALLVKNGSDRNGEPYPRPVADPVHPPLNPNLRVYVEVGNELWNWAALGTYAPYFDLQEEVLDMRKANAPDYQLLNFDGLCEKGGVDDKGRPKATFALSMRWWTLKLARYSDVLRGVFGDDAMPATSRCPRVRPYFGWQYNNMAQTCVDPLSFLEHTLNNPNLAKVPRPPNYFIYAGGGAGYYSAENSFGLIEGTPAAGDFEEPKVETFQKSPAVTGWTFSGDAGICRSGFDMPKPDFGQQALYLKGKGASASFTFTAAKTAVSPFYGVNYRAVLPKDVAWEWSDGAALKVFVDGKDVTNKAGWGTQPIPWTDQAKWNRKAYWVGSWYYSEELRVEPGASVTVTFTCETDKCPVFVDKVTMAGLDAFFASEMPSGGAATGQEAVRGTSYAAMIFGDGRWAATYGLEYMTYEHGWSAGGDAGDTAVQVRAKFLDPRAADSVVRALNIFARAGGYNATFGTYSIWPPFNEILRVEGSLNVDAWPLTQGMNTFSGILPPDVENGAPIPAALFGKQFSASPNPWEVRYDAMKPGQWLGYNFVAQVPGRYRVAVQLAGGGEAALSVNGCAPVLAQGKSDGQLVVEADLKFGVNSVRITGRSGETKVLKVFCAPLSLPEAGMLALRAKYRQAGGTKTESKGRLLLSDDFSGAPGPLHGRTGGKGWAAPWEIQGGDTTIPGFEVTADAPLETVSGLHASGGIRFLSCGRGPDFAQMPKEMVVDLDGGSKAYGAPGTSLTTRFRVRLDDKSASPMIGWSRSGNIPDHGSYAAVLTVRNGTWQLAMRDGKGEFLYADSHVAAQPGKTSAAVLKLEFNEYGAVGTLSMDGAPPARLESDGDIVAAAFVFFPGPNPGSTSMDDLAVSD